jgi:hypothetical protein
MRIKWKGALKKRLAVGAICIILAGQYVLAQNLGSSPQFNVAVQGQTGARPEGAFLNFINWVGNVIAPVGAGGAVLGAGSHGQRFPDRGLFACAIRRSQLTVGLVIAHGQKGTDRGLQLALRQPALFETLPLGLVPVRLLSVQLQHGGGDFETARPMAAPFPGMDLILLQAVGIGLHDVAVFQE